MDTVPVRADSPVEVEELVFVLVCVLVDVDVEAWPISTAVESCPCVWSWLLVLPVVGLLVVLLPGRTAVCSEHEITVTRPRHNTVPRVLPKCFSAFFFSLRRLYAQKPIKQQSKKTKMIGPSKSTHMSELHM